MKGIRQFSLLSDKGNCLLFFLLFLTAGAFAQKRQADSISVNTPHVLTDSNSVIIPDTVPKKADKPHSPKKAAIFSAIIPGSGQVYNKKYWKVPVIYAGFGGLGYLFVQNNKEFKFYRDILLNRADSNATYIDPLPGASSEQVFAYREDFRRYRDLSFIGMFAIYVFNIIDASVDGHMYSFDVSDDLSLNIRPYASPYFYQRPTTGLTFTLHF